MPEKVVSPEREPRYNRVVFGHSFRDFDRDQFLTYFFALKAGLISQDTPVEFTPEVEQADLDNIKVMVIEGVPSGRTDKNYLDSGNFDNADNDDPAAYALYERVQRDLGSTEMNDIARWVRSAETGIPIPVKKPLQKFRISQLRLFTNMVFHGCKQEYINNPTAFVSEITLLFQDFVSSPNKVAFLRDERIQKYIRAAQQEKAKATTQLEQLIKVPGTFEYMTTETGISLARFDVRGSNADINAIRIMLQEIKTRKLLPPDLCLLVADSYSSDVDVTGVKVLLKIPERDKDKKEDDYSDAFIDGVDVNSKQEQEQKQEIEPKKSELESMDLRLLLADRLSYSESLFGRGYTAQFGGHEGIIASSRSGSGLEPEKLWFALCRFFNSHRYTHDEFRAVATRFATDLVGVDTIYTDSHLEADTPGRLPDRYVRITIPDSLELKTEKVVDIKESDISLYTEVFERVCGGNQEQFRAILAKQTDITYAPEVMQYKREQGTKNLQKALDSKSIVALLDILSDFNQESVRKLPIETRLQIIHILAENNEAIDCIWNPNNETYRITTNSVPNYIRDNEQFGKLNKYAYESISQLVDGCLMDSLVREFTLMDRPTALRLLQDVASVLESQSYVESHQSDVLHNDRVVYNFLVCIADAVEAGWITAELGHQLISTTAIKYAPYTLVAYEHIGDERARVLHQLSPETFPASERPTERYRLQLKSNPEARVVTPSREAIMQSLEEQQRQGMSPVVTVLLRMGRPLDEAAWRSGVYRINEEREQNITTVSEVIIPSAINIGAGSNEARQIVDVFAEIIHDILRMVADTPDCKVRIVASGIPNQIALWLGVWVAQNNLTDKVVLCSYNMQVGEYRDFSMTL